jgi:hypothetical protein
MKRTKRKSTLTPANKKVRNAKKINFNGIQFQSRLELHCYKRLIEAGLEFEYEPESFELIPKFEYDNDCYESYKKGTKWLFGEKSKVVRAMKYKPDFVNLKDGWIIECKGHPNESFPIKWKLFKLYLKQRGMNVHLYMPKNQTHVDDCVKNILKTVYGREIILQGKASK